MSEVVLLHPNKKEEFVELQKLRGVLSIFEDRIEQLMLDPKTPKFDDMQVLMMNAVFLSNKNITLPLYTSAEYFSLLMVSYMSDEDFLQLGSMPTKWDLGDLAFLNAIIGPVAHQQKHLREAEKQYYEASLEANDEDKKYFYESLVWNLYSVHWILRDFYKDITATSLTRIK